MQFIKTNKEAKEGIKKLADSLKAGKKVLWLIPGGSNIPLSVEVFRMIPQENLANLTVTLSDERYGPVGHKDSNWKQLIDAGFSFDMVKNVPVLIGESIEKTAEIWEKNMQKAFAEADIVVLQAGIGPDGHIAGVLPHSIGVFYQNLVAFYSTPQFSRITLSLNALKKSSAAFVFAFGETKREALLNLKDKKLSLDDEPSQILSNIAESYIFNDQL